MSLRLQRRMPPWRVAIALLVMVAAQVVSAGHVHAQDAQDEALADCLQCHLDTGPAVPPAQAPAAYPAAAQIDVPALRPSARTRPQYRLKARGPPHISC